MKTEIHFVVDNIENILFWPMKKTYYTWFEESQEQRTFFGLIVKRPYLKAGYDTSEFHKCYSENDYYGDHAWWSPRYSHEDLVNKGLVPVVAETSSGETMWYKQAEVVVNKRGGKHQYVRQFKSNEEAKNWIEHLKKQTNDRFEVIINE